MTHPADPNQDMVRRNPYYEEMEEEEISLLDYAVVITKNLKFIIATTFIVSVLGVVFALFSSPEYTSSAQVIREVPSEGGSSSLAALRSFGLNLGGGSTGLNPETIPDIIKSREVVLSVAYCQYKFPDEDTLMTYVGYLTREGALWGKIFGTIKKYTIGLPRTILSLFRKKVEIVAVDGESGKIRVLSEEEIDAIEALKNMLSVDVARESGIMTLSVTTNDPMLSASIAASYMEHLTSRVRDIYTQKSRDNVDFIRARFEETEKELTAAEDDLAKFVDSNLRPAEQQLQVEINRLQRKVSFKAQLYQELQSQLTQAEIELQKADPVLTIIDQPVPPLQKSGPNRKLMVILAFFLGGGLALGIVFVREYVGNLKQDDESREKVEEITNDVKELWDMVYQKIRRIKGQKPD